MLTIRHLNDYPWNHQLVSEITVSKFLIRTKTNKSTPEIATDSSLDTSSIEVIQPNEGLAIKLPQNLPQRVPPNSPESPRTNVTVSTPQDLFTEDEDTEDDDVPLTTTTVDT